MKHGEGSKAEIIGRLLSRRDRSKRAEQRLGQIHPEAPEKAISTLAFHMYTDGTGALVDLLTEQEEFLAGARDDLSYGTVHHVLYHLYNYLLAERLLAPDRHEIATDLRDVLWQVAEAQPDLGAIKSQLESICGRLEGHESPPSID